MGSKISNFYFREGFCRRYPNNFSEFVNYIFHDLVQALLILWLTTYCIRQKVFNDRHHIFVEFDPYTFILVYNYPEKIQNYPNIAQNFQHIINNPGAISAPAYLTLSPLTRDSSSLQSIPKRHQSTTALNNYNIGCTPKAQNKIIAAKRIGKSRKPNWVTIQQKCQFNLIQAQKHVFQIPSNQWIIFSPTDFPTTIKYPPTFTSITARSLKL
jgi:hypothetical protein